MANGSMVLDIRVDETLEIIVPPKVTVDSRKITITLKHKDGQRARLVVRADPAEFLIDRRRLVTRP